MEASESDAALRPCITLKEGEAKHSDLTDLIAKLARIHTENPEFHGGRYQELLLTNRQYAFARHAQGSICITAANSDDQESRLSTLPGNSSVVLKIRED